MNLKARIMWDGAVAGLLGAGTVALWFLLFDLSRGRPFETPALLASILLYGGGALAASQWLLVLEYTALHVVAFLAFGIAGGLLIEAAERERSLILSLLIFLVAFEGFFLAVVMFMGPELAATLSWWSVLVGNLLATVVMLTYFFSRHPRLGADLIRPWLNVAFEGVVAGLIGGGVVAVWFLLCDFGSGDPFRTPGLLGAVLLQGIRNPTAVQITPALVLGYSVLHFAAFISFGVVAACFVAASEREPVLLLGFLILFACFEVFFLGFAAIISHSLLEQLGWSTVVAGNLLASTAMLVFFYLRHRQLHVRLVERWASQE